MDKTEKRTAEAMTPTERQRIEKDAEAYASSLNCADGTARFDYIAGATAWHDKARNQAIQDCIDELTKHLEKLPKTKNDSDEGYSRGIANCINLIFSIKDSEQLKTKP